MSQSFEQHLTTINKCLALSGDSRKITLDMDPCLGVELTGLAGNYSQTLLKEKNYAGIRALSNATHIIEGYFTDRRIEEIERQKAAFPKEKSLLPGYEHHKKTNQTTEATSTSNANHNIPKPSKP
jgi:hypothetical protein